MTSLSSESSRTAFSDEPRSSGLCMYQRHSCSRPRYRKFEYCVDHILEDETSPFTFCEYLSRTSGRKCPNPALRSKKTNSLPAFCEEHLRDLVAKEQHQKKKKKLRKKRKTGKLPESDSTLTKKQKLVEQVAKIGQYQSKTSAQESSDTEDEIVHRPITDDWALEMSEDLANNADWDDFDPVNNEVYEPLRYADVLTPEEVVATAQSKLIRLQSLYIEQFKRLFHILKEKRRQYLLERKKEIKEEKMSGGSNSNAAKESFDEEEILALANYRKRTGVEALLRKRQQRRRLEAGAGLPEYFGKPTTVQSRCSHASNHMRCKSSCLPYTKYCASHIMEDPHQLLYKKCHTDLCPNAVCYLTSRPYQAESNDDQSKPADVCYCSIHAPLPEMTFQFPAERTDDVSMDVDINAAELPVPMAVKAESAQDYNVEVDETMQIDSVSSEKLGGQVKSSHSELTSDDTQKLDSAISENSSAQTPMNVESSSTFAQREISNFDSRSVDNTTELPNVIHLTMPDRDKEKDFSQVVPTINHGTAAEDIIDLTDESTIDKEAPGNSTKRELSIAETKKQHSFGQPDEVLKLDGSVLEEKSLVSTPDSCLQIDGETPMDISASKNESELANMTAAKSPSLDVIDLTDDNTNDGKGCESLPGGSSAGSKQVDIGGGVVDLSNSGNSQVAHIAALNISPSFQDSSSILSSPGLIDTSMQSSLLTGDTAPDSIDQESTNTVLESLMTTKTLPSSDAALLLDSTVPMLPDSSRYQIPYTQEKAAEKTAVNPALGIFDSLNKMPDTAQPITHAGAATSAGDGILSTTCLEKTKEQISFPISSGAENVQTSKKDGSPKPDFVRDAARTEGSSESVTIYHESESHNPCLDGVQGQALEVEQPGVAEDKNFSSKVAMEANTSNENNNCSAIGGGRFQKNIDNTDSSSDLESGETNLFPTTISSVSSLIGSRGERKPSSADEEMAIASLLSLCTGHPSDDNVPSSSTDQE